MNTTPRKPLPAARAARRRRQARSRAFDYARWAWRRLTDTTIETQATRMERKFVTGLTLIPRFRYIL